MISSMLQTGLSGVLDGLRRMDKAAGQIARSGDIEPLEKTDVRADTTDIAEPLLELKLYERNVNASANVVKTADEVLGTLMDIKA
jgi:flagellar hook protein FlgE